MDNSSVQIGKFDFDINQIIMNLENFVKLYKQRPIKNNIGGMGFSNMFFFYLILKMKKPSFVIESGIFKGQSTWLIENTLPKCEILSIDIDLSQREFISKKSNYSNKDFKFQDLKNIPRDTMVFFDDHVNHLDRLMEAKFFNIKNIIFEDNYPSGRGDFQTLKQIYNSYTFNHKPGLLSLIKTGFIFNKMLLRKIFKSDFSVKFEMDKISKRIRDGYKVENFQIIQNNLSVYYEFPLSILDIFNKEKINNNNFNNLIPDELIQEINLYKSKSPFTYLELI